MANNNVQNIKFLRNGALYTTREAALTALTGSSSVASSIADGTAILARYGSGNNVKTIVGFKYTDGTNSSLTIFDTEGASADVEKLREEIDAKLGTGITSGNTATAQLAALSGNAQSTSADTSVAGAKKYADEKIKQAVEGLDAEVTSTDGKNVQVKVTEADGKITAVNITTDNTVNSGYVDSAITTAINALDGSVTAADGYYVKSVNEADGKISGTTAALPTVAAISEAGKPITAVSESLGAISATAGTINADYVNIADSGSLITATTVEGALAEIAAEIDAMDKAASAEDGKVVTTVSEADGVVSETKVNVKDLQLGGYTKDTTATGDIASDDTINAALSKLENKASAITIANADGSINVTTGASGTDINVNIKSTEKVIKKDGNGGIYTNLNLVEITGDTLPAEIKVRYELRDSDNIKIGESIDIPKDSHIVSITYITDTGDTHYQNLEYVYIDASGNTQTTYVDMSALVLEAEFESGVTATNHVVHGVVDATSEKDSQETPADFLTVGADGFKVSGIKDEIDRKINALDATVGSTTVATDKHVAVQVVEEDGKLTGLTVTEGNIANATDLAALSAKTVTEIASSNNSIAASSAATTGGTVKFDVITDADKIKMSGFSASDTSSLSGIAQSDSIATAFEKTNTVITENKRVTSEKLTGLDGRLNVIESGYVETVKVNNVALTETSHAVNVQISGATTAATATGNEAIVVTTGADGVVTLGIATLDCGTY